MKKQEKIEIINEWLKTIETSWTWPLLTDGEKNKFKEYLFCDSYIPIGNKKQIWACLNNYYHFFVIGIELNDKKRLLI